MTIKGGKTEVGDDDDDNDDDDTHTSSKDVSVSEDCLPHITKGNHLQQHGDEDDRLDVEKEANELHHDF